ncbi:hypothetical protein [Niabella hirudinis]|uniref:hypothetical protein n=1 Tax=Niabella hirudinis TaxID=1285929 RepID=UPI003EB80CFE
MLRKQFSPIDLPCFGLVVPIVFYFLPEIIRAVATIFTITTPPDIFVAEFNRKGAQGSRKVRHAVIFPGNRLRFNFTVSQTGTTCNPGFVFEPQDWKYSTAIDYYTNQKGLLDLVI